MSAIISRQPFPVPLPPAVSPSQLPQALLGPERRLAGLLHREQADSSRAVLSGPRRQRACEHLCPSDPESLDSCRRQELTAYHPHSPAVRPLSRQLGRLLLPRAELFHSLGELHPQPGAPFHLLSPPVW